MTARITDWSPQAACRGRMDLFYAPHRERPPARLRREAEGRRVCASCPVRLPCQEHARAHHEFGLWGGEAEDERAAAGYPASALRVEAVRRPLDAAG